MLAYGCKKANGLYNNGLYNKANGLYNKANGLYNNGLYNKANGLLGLNVGILNAKRAG